MQPSLSRFLLLTALLIPVAGLRPQVPAAPEIPANQMVRIRNVQGGEMATPEYSVSVRGTSTRRDRGRSWLVLTSEFDTQAPWLDEITFTFYVVLEAKPGDLPPGAPTKNLFSGSVTYMNVKRGQHVASVYLDPNTFERYGRPTHVAVIANIEGQQAGGAAQPPSSAQAQWWRSQTPHAIPLLRRDQTPFVNVEIESHNTIKP